MLEVTAWRILVGTALVLGIVTIILIVSGVFTRKNNNESFGTYSDLCNACNGCASGNCAVDSANSNPSCISTTNEQECTNLNFINNINALGSRDPVRVQLEKVGWEPQGMARWMGSCPSN